MGSEDWYRMTDWTEEGAALFEHKIARARSQKAQYLAIQAYHLLDARPDISLILLDRAEAADAKAYEGARINNFRAEANLRMGRIEEVLAAYKDSMAAQAKGGAIFTSSALDFAFVVAYFGIEEEYGEALKVLSQYRGSPLPNTDAQAFGALTMILADKSGAVRAAGAAALIEAELEKHGSAKALAHRALEAFDTGDADVDTLKKAPNGISAKVFRERLREIADG